MLVLGSADDCDMIFADTGVAAHHAILTITPASWSLRALDRAVSAGGRNVAAGDSADLAWFEIAEFGPVALSVGDEDGEQWAALLGEGAQAAASDAGTARARRRWWIAAAIGIPICAATAITAATLRPQAREPAPSQRSLLEQTVRDSGLESWRIEESPSGRLRVVGFASDEKSIERLRKDVAADGIPAEIAVRSGNNVARDVAEVLRLSDLRAEAAYRGKGEVAIRGHFGDGKALDTVLASRALRDIRGLSKVSVVNLDSGAPAAEPVGVDDKARHILVAVGGHDPYVIMADGSRYFAGAALPCGGRLHAVDGQEIFVDEAGDTSAVECTGAVTILAVGQAAKAGPPKPERLHVEPETDSPPAKG